MCECEGVSKNESVCSVVYVCVCVYVYIYVYVYVYVYLCVCVIMCVSLSVGIPPILLSDGLADEYCTCE